MKSRSFSVATRDGRAVAEAMKLFQADVTRQPYKPSTSNLVVSPDTSREMLSMFIRGARRDLTIYDVRVEDPAMLKLLRERASKGVRIRVIGEARKAGPEIEVRSLKSMRLHVRAIVRDGVRAFVGSQSLKKAELDSRREVGVFIRNPTVIKKLMQVFEQDWDESCSKEERKEEEARKEKDDTAVI